MAEEQFNRMREKIIGKLKMWVDSVPEPDAPLYHVAGFEDEGEGEHEATTPRQIFQQVVQGTKEGNDLIERWIDLAIEDVMEADLGTKLSAAEGFGESAEEPTHRLDLSHYHRADEEEGEQGQQQEKAY